MKLWLVRHAAPEVAPGVCYGRLDVPASAGATQQAAATLAAALPPSVRLATSPALRCRQLAEAVTALRPDLQPTEDPRLAEMDFGAWEGRLWDAIGQPAIDAWTADFFRFAPGGGESLQALMARVGAALAAAHRGRHDSVWITHAGVIRAAGLLARGVTHLGDASQWPREGPGFGAWTVLDLP